MRHELKREYGGSGPMGWIKPTCSCGWSGTAHFAYEDYQITGVKQEEGNHARAVQRESADSGIAAIAAQTAGETN